MPVGTIDPFRGWDPSSSYPLYVGFHSKTRLAIQEVSLPTLSASGPSLLLQFYPSTVRESRKVSFATDDESAFLSQERPVYKTTAARRIRMRALIRDHASPDWPLGSTQATMSIMRQWSERRAAIGHQVPDNYEPHASEPSIHERVVTGPAANPGYRGRGEAAYALRTAPFYYKTTQGRTLSFSNEPPLLMIRAHDVFFARLMQYEFDVKGVSQNNGVYYPTWAEVNLTFIEQITDTDLLIASLRNFNVDPARQNTEPLL